MDFSHILLEDEQKELFIRIAEAVKKIPREERCPMMCTNYGTSDGLVIFSIKSGIIEDMQDIVSGDLDTLAKQSILSFTYSPKRSKNYIITPEGFEYYEWLMSEQGKPIERIQTNIRGYLDFQDFRSGYEEAYKRIVKAEELLWSSDSPENFSIIGHLCREAMQEFADELYHKVMGERSTEEKNKDLNRIKAVIASNKSKIGDKVSVFLEAQYELWKSVNGLVQRQEHAGQKEGEPITWEDARRIVFQTINVMYELHRTVGR